MTDHRFNQLCRAARSACSSGDARRFRQALDLLYLEVSREQLDELERTLDEPPLRLL